MPSNTPYKPYKPSYLSFLELLLKSYDNWYENYYRKDLPNER